MTLAEIVIQAGEILTALEACEGELTPETEAVLADISRQFAQKAEAIVYVLDAMKADAMSAKALSQHYEDKADVIGRKADRLRERLAWAMEAAGQTKVATPHGNLVLGSSETVEITGMVPERYMNPPKVTEPTPDKAAIKKAIKAGEEVPGARIITTKHVKVT